MKTKDFLKTILALSLPTAFQKLISLVVVMADNLMVSKIDTGGIAFAAVSQSNTITNLLIAFVMGLAGGSIVLVSQYWGKKDTVRIKSVYSVALTVCVAISLVFIFAIFIFPRQIISIVLSSRDTAVVEKALEYLKIVSLSYLPFAISTAFIAMLKGIEIVKITLVSTIVALISNIFFNYIMIFGKLGFPQLGVSGAALATVISRLIEAAFVSIYFFRGQKRLNITLKDLTKHKKWAWEDYKSFGLPVAITDVQWAIVGLIKMAIIGQLGRVMINAIAVTDMMMNLGTLFTFSLASGASVIVGKASGAKNYDLVKEYSKKIQLSFLVFGVIAASLVYLLKNPFISLYSLEIEASNLAEKAIALCSITLIGTCYHAACFIGINRGAGDSKFVMKVDMICGWLIVLPLSALSTFVFNLPLHLVYFTTRIDQSFKWIIAFIRLRGNKWIHNVTRT